MCSLHLVSYFHSDIELLQPSRCKFNTVTRLCQPLTEGWENQFLETSCSKDVSFKLTVHNLRRRNRSRVLASSCRRISFSLSSYKYRERKWVVNFLLLFVIEFPSITEYKTRVQSGRPAKYIMLFFLSEKPTERKLLALHKCYEEGEG